jgi:hypothetical protein
MAENKNLLIFGKVAVTIHVTQDSPENPAIKTANAVKGKVCPDRFSAVSAVKLSFPSVPKKETPTLHLFAPTIALKPPETIEKYRLPVLTKPNFADPIKLGGPRTS